MEKNNTDAFLKKLIADEGAGFADPSPSLVMEARNKVAARKNQQNEKADMFLFIARFLNMHTRLSYAVILVLSFCFASLYLTKINSSAGESTASPDVVNIASARSTTVLSSIITFETRK